MIGLHKTNKHMVSAFLRILLNTAIEASLSTPAKEATCYRYADDSLHDPVEDIALIDINILLIVIYNFKNVCVRISLFIFICIYTIANLC